MNHQSNPPMPSGVPHDASRPMSDADIEEFWREHVRHVTRIKAAHAVTEVVIGAIAYVMFLAMRGLGGGVESIVLPLVVFVFGSVLVVRSTLACLSRLGGEPTALAMDRCDVRAYRSVLGRMASRRLSGMPPGRLVVERARCDWLDDDPRGALATLDAARIGGAGAEALMAANIRANAFDALGMTTERDMAVSDIAAIGARYRAGSPVRKAVDTLMADMAVVFRPSALWTRTDETYMRGRMETDGTRLGRNGWRIKLAEYHALHGDAAYARTLLEPASMEPMTRRHRHERDRVLFLMG